MLEVSDHDVRLVGPKGSICVPSDDEIARKLSMLFEGQCEGLGATQAAKKHGYCRQRYYQLLKSLEKKGLLGLQSQRRGPKSNYVRTDQVAKEVIRYRFLDPDATPEVIAQKIEQCGRPVSTRSVERIIEQYGLQKKTLQVQARSRANRDRDAED